jgi:hypothetical protein
MTNTKQGKSSWFNFPCKGQETCVQLILRQKLISIFVRKKKLRYNWIICNFNLFNKKYEARAFKEIIP